MNTHTSNERIINFLACLSLLIFSAIPTFVSSQDLILDEIEQVTTDVSTCTTDYLATPIKLLCSAGSFNKLTLESYDTELKKLQYVDED